MAMAQPVAYAEAPPGYYVEQLGQPVYAGQPGQPMYTQPAPTVVYTQTGAAPAPATTVVVQTNARVPVGVTPNDSFGTRLCNSNRTGSQYFKIYCVLCCWITAFVILLAFAGAEPWRVENCPNNCDDSSTWSCDSGCELCESGSSLSESGDDCCSDCICDDGDGTYSCAVYTGSSLNGFKIFCIIALISLIVITIITCTSLQFTKRMSSVTVLYCCDSNVIVEERIRGKVI